jgi:hypothetical protein
MRKYLVALGAVVFSAPVAAAEVSPALKEIVTRWDRCFLASTQSQFLANIDAEPNMVAEIAFTACSTEEQSLLTYLTLNSTPYPNARAIVLRHRGILKAKITG